MRQGKVNKIGIVGGWIRGKKRAMTAAGANSE